MIRFECDYSEGMHPKILQRLAETNFVQTPGYGCDEFCIQAKEKIQAACKRKVELHFAVGGTQANTLVISSILKPYQGVIACDSGHIATHETGAIEATGHKVLTVMNHDGKLTASQIRTVLEQHKNDANYEHTVQPAMVYISHPTELGTLYTKSELEAIHAVCQEAKIPLFVDGARLGYALATPCNDVTLADLCDLTDVFYIGGTKVGALMGEAIVFTNDRYHRDFRYHIKMRGAMLAKGRFLGLQFDTLFTDNLYFKISQNAIIYADVLRTAFRQQGIEFWVDSPTNQLFPILTMPQLQQLRQQFSFNFWQQLDDEHAAVRFCTSWATRKVDVLKLVQAIRQL